MTDNETRDGAPERVWVCMVDLGLAGVSRNPKEGYDIEYRRVSPVSQDEELRLRQAIGWILDAADAAYNEDSDNVRIHEIFNIAAKASGVTRRLPDEYQRFTEDSDE